MGKDTTLQIKGILILMMLWLHLYSNEDLFNGTCYEFLYWFNGNPFSYHFAKKFCSMCVPAYIFLSGYGLGKVYNKKALSNQSMGNGKRCFNLYVRLWVIIAIFMPIGCYFNPEHYPYSMLELVENMTGISTYYNGAWWFLLPYIILAMSSRYFIRYIMRFGKKGDIVNTFMLLAISVFGYVAIAKVNDSTDILMRLLTGLMATLYLSFMFFVGIMFVKHNVIERAINRMATVSNATRYSLAAVVVLIIGRLCMGNSALIHIPFTPLIILSLAILLNGKSNKFLQLFGHHSTNMWLVHFFFITYIFDGQIYILRYPIVIFVALVAISLATSKIIDRILTYVQPLLNKWL